MGKRNIVIASSSDEECGNTREKSSKSKSRTPLTSKKSRESKKFATDDRYDKFHEIDDFQYDMIVGDFFEGFPISHVGKRKEYGLNVGSLDINEPWVAKYKPCSLSELAVHKKKIEEVRSCLEQMIKASKKEPRGQGQVLLIIGPAGVGKSETIHLVVQQLGAELYEWRTPVPTLWQEHLHNSNSGAKYVSKMEEFEIFLEKIGKYPVLPLTSMNGSKRPVILLIDDLPSANGRASCTRLMRSLHVLVKSTQFPTVILITEYSKNESGDNSMNYSEEFQSSLEISGAQKVTFNPITTNAIKKILSRICKEERLNVNPECIDMIAKSSGGDIRNAITSLQYLCLKSVPMLFSPSNVKMNPPKKLVLDSFSYSCISNDEGLFPSFRFSCGRDETLSLFHALGKFLHNKRESTPAGQCHFRIQDKFARCPLKMDAPEIVLTQAHGQARPVADFLHENVLDFLSDDGIDDAWTIASYLSDADFLLASSLRGPLHMFSNKYAPENILQLSATSVAVRGVMFGNSQPSPSRWHSIRRPMLWQIDKSLQHNQNEMIKQKFEALNQIGSMEISAIATEYRPLLKWLSQLPASQPMNPKVEEGNMDVDKIQNETSEESEDEIEDW